MAVPEGYTVLAKVGLVNKGEYSAAATYNKFDFVYNSGSSWLAKKDGLKGVSPADGEDWQCLAKGFVESSASELNITDASNVTGVGAGKTTTMQNWADSVGTFVTTKAVTNDSFTTKFNAKLANNGTTEDEGSALDARYGKTLQDAVNELQAQFETVHTW